VLHFRRLYIYIYTLYTYIFKVYIHKIVIQFFAETGFIQPKRPEHNVICIYI
jgi:hypothetical protein